MPEARLIVKRAAQIYLQHTEPWCIGILIHGSAYKGGFIPNCSDIDLQLFLQLSAFDASGQLPLEITLAVHRDLATIDPGPFQYIQCYAFPDQLTVQGQKGSVGPLPGTYHLLYGRLPVPEATAEEVVRESHKLLSSSLLPEYQSPGGEIRDFSARCHEYHVDDASVENAMTLIDSGIAFKRAVGECFDRMSDGHVVPDA